MRRPAGPRAPNRGQAEPPLPPARSARAAQESSGGTARRRPRRGSPPQSRPDPERLLPRRLPSRRADRPPWRGGRVGESARESRGVPAGRFTHRDRSGSPARRPSGPAREQSAGSRSSPAEPYPAPPPRWQSRCRPARPSLLAAGRALPARRLRGGGPRRCWVRRRAARLGALGLVLENGGGVSCVLLWQICEVSQHQHRVQKH